MSSFFEFFLLYPRLPQKKFSPLGPTVWSRIGNIYTIVLFHYIELAEGPGVARGEKN